MSNYEQSRYSRTYPHSSVDTGSYGFFWGIVVFAAIALLVLIIALGSGPAPVEHPGGAGAEPIIVPTEPDASATSTGVVIE